MARNTQPIPPPAQPEPALGTVAQLRHDLEEIRAYLATKEHEAVALVERVESQGRLLAQQAETLAEHAAHFVGL